MSVARQILFLIILVFSCAMCFAQRERIDSLKKILPHLKDSGRINCLNELSLAYHEIQADTARMYVNQALKESERIHYVRGMATAYKYMGRIECAVATDFLSAEKYFILSLQLYKKTGDEREIGWVWFALGYAKWVLSKFPEAMEAYEKAEQLLKKTGDTNTLAIVYEQMGLTALAWGHYEKAMQAAIRFEELTGEEHTYILAGLYETLGDYETALEYHRKAPTEGHNWEFKYLSLGIAFYHKNQYDSALYYYKLFGTFAKKSGEANIGKLYAYLGELHFALKHYDTAFSYLDTALTMHKGSTDQNQVMRVQLILGKIYKENGDFKRSMKTAKELLQLADQTGALQYSSDAHLLLYELFDQMPIKDSAYRHLQQYTLLKDSIDLNISAQKLAVYQIKSERERAQTRINTLNDEKKLQQQKLEQTAQQKNFLIVGSIALLLIAVVIFRNISLKRKNEKLRMENELKLQKVESEKTKVELQQQATELEMQALRSQMNPHFIFNCLSSINRFILKNESEMASDYLTKFSRLVRLILQNSQAAFISLESELESLQLYLELEALRFNHRFDYRLNVADGLDMSAIKVPPLIIQPYAENAIWHGLMQKEEKGNLDIAIEQDNDHLIVRIADDGIGRKAAAELASKSATKHKSVGLKITAERIAMLQSSNGSESPVTINDLVNADGTAAGTEVIIKIPVIY